MTCTEATRIIHLNRPGERTEREERDLELHLRGCDLCRAEADMVRRTSRSMDTFLLSGVPQPNVARETGRIMQALDDTSPSPGIVDRLLDLAGHRSVRLAYGLLSCAVLATMAGQLFSETALPVREKVRTGPYLSYRVDKDELKRLASIPLPEALSRTLTDDAPDQIRSDEVARTLRYAGQAFLHSVRVSEEQKRMASAIIEALIRTSEPTVRFGIIGG